MAPPYGSYAALAAEQVEGVDYRREHRTPAGAGWLCMAVHGGRIEAATAEVASAVAAQRMAYYGFIGTKATGNADLHITSSLVDYPDLLTMLPAARRILSIHGMAGTVGVPEVAIGGLDDQLMDAVAAALSTAGFAVGGAPAELAGDNLTNICNRGVRRAGCQLELSRALRDSFSPTGDIAAGSVFEAGARTAVFDAFVAALRGVQLMLLAYDAGLSRVRITGPAPGLRDGFGRTAVDTWAAADSGQVWTNSGTTTAFSVSGGLGRHSLSAVNSSRYSTIATGRTDWDLSATIATDVLAAGGSHFLALVGRYADVSNMYLARLEFTTAAAVNLTIRKRVAGTETLIGTTYTTGLTHTAGGRVAIRFRAAGSTLQAKTWLASGAEPAAWQREVTDTDLTAGDSVGVRSILSSSNTNTLPVTATWDDVLMRGVVQIQRSTDAIRWTTVRGAAALTGPPVDLHADDYEFAADVADHYRTRLLDAVSGVVVVEGDQETITPVLGGVWLKSVARSYLNRRVSVGEIGDVSRPSRAGIFDVVGRSYPVAVHEVRGSRRWTMVVRTADAVEGRAVELLLASGDTLYIHVPADRPNVPGGYVSVGDTQEHPFGPVETRRRWSLPCTEVAAPGPDVVGVTATCASILAAYATCADLLAAFGTCADVLEYVASPEDVIVP